MPVKKKQQSVGSLLQASRQERDVSLEDIAEETRIRLVFLEAIEADNDDVLPAGVYKRLYIRSYCKFLKIDSDDILKKILEAPEQNNDNFEIDNNLKNQSSGPSKDVVIISAILALVLIIVFVMLASTGGDSALNVTINADNISSNELEVKTAENVNDADDVGTAFDAAVAKNTPDITKKVTINDSEPQKIIVGDEKQFANQVSNKVISTVDDEINDTLAATTVLVTEKPQAQAAIPDDSLPWLADVQTAAGSQSE